jgi:DNA polymerase III epsilon subunit-like protein
MNTNYILSYDFETSSADPTTTQILQIGACIVERNNLTIVDKFESLLRPVDFESVEDGALKVNKLTIEQLEQAPETKLVWDLFTNWVQKYNKSKKTFSAWNNPVQAGYNICNFDSVILKRYCKEYGPWNDKRNEQKLVHPVYTYDVLQHLFLWFENNAEMNRLNLSATLEYFGVSKETIEGAHRADFDVAATTAILIKLLKMERYLTSKDKASGNRKLEMKGCMAGWSYE